jgi:hemerythrin superfamily protein
VNDPLEGGNLMKATALLEKQHRKVEELFASLEASRANAKLVEELATALTAHSMIEEEIFYPEAKRVKKDLVLESYEEHDLVAYAVKRLVACDPEDERFQPRVKAVKELVEQHVEEEEQDLFPAVSEALGGEEQALGERMQARFEELSRMGYEGALAEKKAKRTDGGTRSHGKTAEKKKGSHAHARHA